MPSKPVKQLICMLALLPLSASLFAAGELSTLFTTPQERQLINSNRYKTDEVKQQVVVEEAQQSPVQILAREEISTSYQISGISLAADGHYTVWINSRAYQDGEALDDMSRIKVIVGENLKLRITAPDGKHYYATSGETVDVTYMAAVDN